MKRLLSGIIVVALALLGSLPLTASAGEPVTYTKQAFLDAQNTGKPIVVFVTASWCPNCRKQQPVVSTLAADKAFADAVVFVIDYDADKEALRDFNVRMQSTLIAFKGKSERMRSTAGEGEEADDDQGGRAKLVAPMRAASPTRGSVF